jgi:hypothetical protein
MMRNEPSPAHSTQFIIVKIAKPMPAVYPGDCDSFVVASGMAIAH